MSVFVDDMRADFGRMKMCHMIADSTAELLAMVDKIGVARHWIQKSGDALEHFDICLSKRRLAVANGAIEISQRDLGAKVRRGRETMKKTSEAQPAQPPRLSEHQKFRSETIARSRMKNAPYNPRKDLTAAQKEKLRTSLDQFGLVMPPVWNKRTENIVGGHKRLAELDDLHAGAEYSLTVAVVDLDQEKEKALNVILNSPEIGAEFDQDRLGTLLDELRGKLKGPSGADFDLDALISKAHQKSAALLAELTGGNGNADNQPLLSVAENESAVSGDEKKTVREKEKPPRRGAIFEVVIECRDQEHQQEVFESIAGQGEKCRLFTL